MKKIYLLLMLPVLSLSAQKARADIAQTAAATLRRPLGVRAAGMGQAFAGADGGIDSLGYNPAGLASVENPVFQTAYTHGIIDDHFSYGAYAHPLRAFTLAAGFLYYDAGTINLNLSNGANGDVKAQQDFAGLAAVGFKPLRGFSAGVMAKLYRLNLAQAASARGGAFDGGVLWQLAKTGFALGSCVQNIGPDVKFEESGDPLPLTMRLGASYRLKGPDDAILASGPNFLVTLDAVKVRDSAATAGAGGEISLPYSGFGSAALRLGAVFNNQSDWGSVGFGIKERRFLFDYALGMKRSLNNIHHFSLGFRF